MIVPLIIIFIITALLFSALAGRFSAMQDAVKHFPRDSVFSLTAKEHPTRFGILSEYWYNQNGKDWLGKYEDYDPDKPLRKFRILFFSVHLVQLTDAWHWWKMWKIGFEKLTDVFAASAAVLLFYYLEQQSSLTNLAEGGQADYIVLIMSASLFIYFWLNSFAWILSFNIYYDKLLRLT